MNYKYALPAISSSGIAVHGVFLLASKRNRGLWPIGTPQSPGRLSCLLRGAFILFFALIFEALKRFPSTKKKLVPDSGWRRIELIFKLIGCQDFPLDRAFEYNGGAIATGEINSTSSVVGYRALPLMPVRCLGCDRDFTDRPFALDKAVAKIAIAVRVVLTGMVATFSGSAGITFYRFSDHVLGRDHINVVTSSKCNDRSAGRDSDELVLRLHHRKVKAPRNKMFPKAL